VTRPSFLRRIAALLIDYCLILGWMAVIAVVSSVIALSTGGFANWLAWGTAAAQLAGFLVLVLPVGVYLFLTESSTRQATLGKRALRMRVVGMDGKRASRGRILVRTIVKLLPWEFAHFMVWNVVDVASRGGAAFPGWLVAGLVVADAIPVGYVLVVALQHDRRGPHDLVAGTRVVSFPR
jgi:uncharacterized RDD family membrane protein YckC